MRISSFIIISMVLTGCGDIRARRVDRDEARQRPPAPTAPADPVEELEERPVFAAEPIPQYGTPVDGAAIVFDGAADCRIKVSDRRYEVGCDQKSLDIVAAEASVAFLRVDCPMLADLLDVHVSGMVGGFGTRLDGKRSFTALAFDEMQPLTVTVRFDAGFLGAPSACRVDVLRQVPKHTLEGVRADVDRIMAQGNAAEAAALLSTLRERDDAMRAAMALLPDTWEDRAELGSWLANLRREIAWLEGATFLAPTFDGVFNPALAEMACGDAWEEGSITNTRRGKLVSLPTTAVVMDHCTFEGNLSQDLEKYDLTSVTITSDQPGIAYETRTHLVGRRLAIGWQLIAGDLPETETLTLRLNMKDRDDPSHVMVTTQAFTRLPARKIAESIGKPAVVGTPRQDAEGNVWLRPLESFEIEVPFSAPDGVRMRIPSGPLATCMAAAAPYGLGAQPLAGTGTLRFAIKAYHSEPCEPFTGFKIKTILPLATGFSIERDPESGVVTGVTYTNDRPFALEAKPHLVIRMECPMAGILSVHLPGDADSLPPGGTLSATGQELAALLEDRHYATIEGIGVAEGNEAMASYDQVEIDGATFVPLTPDGAAIGGG